MAVIANGDVFDGAAISRHPPIGYASRPSVKQELEAVDDFLHSIHKAAGNKSKLFWILGNHCLRFANKLASDAAQFEGVKGFELSDHFAAWKFGLSLWINDSVVVKHRFRGGVHATHNNTLYAGKTIVTGHLHSAKVTPFDDYNGTRFGVDTGCLCDPYDGDTTAYMEDNPRNWRSGFVVLTFVDGQLLMPEIALVWSEDSFQFRGQIIKV